MELHVVELEQLELRRLELRGNPTMQTLPRAVKILIGTATLLGAACVAIRVPSIARWDLADMLAVVVIAGLTIVAERCSIPLRRGSETVNFALTDGVWAGALLLVSPSVLTVAVLLGVGVGQALNRWKPYKIAYNVAQFLVGIDPRPGRVHDPALVGRRAHRIRSCGPASSARCTSRSR